MFDSIQLSRRDLVAGALRSAALVSLPFGASARCETQVDLRHDDLLTFRAAQQLIDEGQSPEAAARWYFENGSPALHAYARIYEVTPERLASRLRTHPRFYKRIAGSIPQFLARRQEIATVMGSLCRLVPTLRPKPIYLFVGVMGHGATPRELDPDGGEESLVVLIPIELMSMFADLDMSEFPDGNRGRGGPEELPAYVAHEMTHVAQVQLQGLDEYRTIYRNPKAGTVLAYAIREGAADLMAYRSGAGLRERHRYFFQNRDRIWTEFQAIMAKPAREAVGWFGGTPKELDGRPPGIGYAVGFAISMAFLNQAGTGEDRILELLSASTSDNFARVLKPYAESRSAAPRNSMDRKPLVPKRF